MRVWKQPFFDDGICQLAVYKFSNASDYQVQQTQNLLLLAQLRNSSFVEIDAETGWEVRTSIIERRPALFFLGHISPIFAPFFLVFSRFSPS